MVLNSGIIAHHKDCTFLLYLKRFTTFLFHFSLIFMKTASCLFLRDCFLPEKIVMIYAQKAELVFTLSPSERNAHLEWPSDFLARLACEPSLHVV